MDPKDPRSVESGWRYALRSLRFRNYRLFFGGQSLSLVGTWMTRLATAWLVYRLTGSALLLGVTGFASQIPAFLLGPFAGVWVDRLDRHRVLIATQVLSMIQSLALAALAIPHRITVPEIIWLSLFQGVINAFDMPARQAFLPQMVERREDLPNAIALNSSMVNGSRLIGPALAGLVIAAWGEGACFLIDGLSYGAVIASLCLMRVQVLQVRRPPTGVWHELREGWHYVVAFTPARNILLLLALASLMGMPYTVLMPIFATKILGGGAHTLGFLMGATGLGALASAAWLASRPSIRGLLRVIPTVSAIFGAGLMVFAFSRWLPVSLALLLFTGFGMMQHMAASNSILQTVVDEDKRGRVMSYYAMAFMGAMPLGSLLQGWVASRIGAPATVAMGGLACLAGAAWFLSRMKEMRVALRPIYTRLGIIPATPGGPAARG